MTAVADIDLQVQLAMDLGADLPDLREVVDRSVRQPEEHERAVYFDSSDRRLWNRGVTLSHRTAEGTPKWILKLPRRSSDDASACGELDWVGAEDRIPEEALDAVSGLLRRMPVEKVAELHTERIRFVLGRDGRPWAELTNDVLTVVGGRADGQRFRLVELDMKSPDTSSKADADTIVKLLRRAGARQHPPSKEERVLGPPERRPPLGRRSPAKDVVTHAISAGLDRLLDHDWRMRLAGAHVDAEDVHQARVATRRLRSDLGTLSSLLDPLWVGHVRADLRWAADALGAVRDIDVLTQRLNAEGARDQLIQILADERAVAVQALQHILTDRRYLDLCDRLHAAGLKPPITDAHLADRKAGQVLPALVRRRWKKLRRDVRNGGRRPHDDQLHQVRKRSKQLRYAAELATPTIGKAAKKTAKTSETLQTLLGDHHDAVVASEWLQRARDRLGNDGTQDVDSMLHQAAQRKEKLSRKWRSPYRRLSKPKRRRWVR